MDAQRRLAAARDDPKSDRRDDLRRHRRLRLGAHQGADAGVRRRYAWTLSADWPRLAMIQSLIGEMIYADTVVYDWAHIKAPTLAFGGDQDMLAGTPAVFQQRMKYIVDTIPSGKGRHMGARGGPPPPRVAFLKEALSQ